MADYLVPMSGEMPDIDVGHVVSPTSETELGAKGAGEAGTAGAAAAVANAVNDALRRLAQSSRKIPLTPQVVLTALDEFDKKAPSQEQTIHRRDHDQEDHLRIDFPSPFAGDGKRRRRRHAWTDLKRWRSTAADQNRHEHGTNRRSRRRRQGFAARHRDLAGRRQRQGWPARPQGRTCRL